MTPARWSQIRQIFERALERPAQDRAAYLRDVCSSDLDLRKEVETLLASHERSGDFLETPAIQMNQIIRENRILPDDRDDFSKGYRIGPYEFERRIGRGGMGAVWLAARHDHEYHKKVAIKMVKPGMNSQDILRRFLTERQVLANLDHPNIARLIDGGSTAEGLPYLVMEYVDGMPIDRYCEKNKLSISQRLKLFRAVCSAVQFAHQNLVVHRDIKSSNILVTADGTPKLLDFGIAKVLRPDSAFDPAQTRPGMRPMTVDYASPEQVMGEPITTATDVYSLGVLLFRLLTGKTPYGTDVQSREALQLAICQKEPLRPSAVILTDEKTAIPEATQKMEAFNESRDKARKRLRKRLTGDLDAIVLMALRKEPRRRYVSAGQFSDDIERHLKGEPVIARLATPGYRLSKFIQRNAPAVAASTVIGVLLIWATVLSQRSAEQALAARDRAEAGLLQTRHALIAAYLKSGDTTQAMEAAHAAYTAAPGSIVTRYDLAEAANAAGDDRMAKGDRAGATALYGESVTQFEAAVQMNTRDLGAQRDLMLAARKLGAIEVENKNVPGALAAYGRALQAAQGLVAAEGSQVSADTQRELAEVTQKIEEISRSAGK